MEIDQEELSQEHDEMKELMKQNSKLIAENNKLLRKIHRNGVWSFWTRIAWYAVMIGMPFALYFYILEPYFAAFGSSYENFIDGINELPGLKGIDQLLNRG